MQGQFIEMTALLVASPFSSRTIDLLAAQLREMQPVTQLFAPPQCISEACLLADLVHCSPVSDCNWTDDPCKALHEVLLLGEGLVVAVVEEEVLYNLQQAGVESAMKVFTVDNRWTVAVVTATERWEELCWKGRLERVHRSVLQAAQDQINEGIKQALVSLDQQQAVKLEILKDLYHAKLDYLQLLLVRCITNFELVFKSITAQNLIYMHDIELLSDRIRSILLSSSSYHAPEPPSAVPRKPAPPPAPRVDPESLSQEWQAKIYELECSLGEQLSQEAVAVLTQLPDAELLSPTDLISALLRAI